MSNEATFRQHLRELENVLGLLQGDIETGPADKINSWYDDTLEDIFNYEDAVEDIVNPRQNYDEDSIDDEDVVENTESDEEEEVVAEELDSEDSKSVTEIDLNSEDTNNDDIKLNKTKKDNKTITININLKSLE